MRAGGFGGLRARLVRQAPDSLVRLIGELYRLSDENRRRRRSSCHHAVNETAPKAVTVLEALLPASLEALVEGLGQGRRRIFHHFQGRPRRLVSCFVSR
jgi:hypothetical protein